MADANNLERSVFGRFLPAACVPYLVVLTDMALRHPGSVNWHPLVAVAVQLAALTGGFGGVLAAARERVAHAPRLGLRTAAAGLLAPLALAAASAFTQGATLTAMGILGVAAGAAAGGLLALSASRRQTQGRLEDPEIQEEVARLDAELATQYLGSGPITSQDFAAPAPCGESGLPEGRTS